MFEETPDGQTHFDPEAERKARMTIKDEMFAILITSYGRGKDWKGDLKEATGDVATLFADKLEKAIENCDVLQTSKVKALIDELKGTND